MLGLSGNAYYGFDAVKLGGWFQPSQPTLQSQMIAEFGVNDFWLGSLGISPVAFNFSTLNEPVPSLLGSLRQSNGVPSLTWAYTAGMPYHQPPIFGSLTLGGYDTSRRSNQTSVSIPFGTDTSRDLLVGLQSITYDTLGSSPLLANGIYAFIDSMVTQMWLPVEVCRAFETAFNLTWNATAQLYLLTASQHAALLAQNPTFTFTVGTSAHGGESAKIVFPYSAFDLSVTQPIVDTDTRYFPLKRANHSSQYTLGRVFFQGAYVVADYDRKNFSVSQAVAPGRGATSSIITIEPPGEVQSHLGGGGNATTIHVSGQLSTGAFAGIIVGGVVGIVLIIIGILWIRKKYFRSDRNEESGYDPRHRFSVARYSGKPSGVYPPVEMNAVDSGIYEPDSQMASPPELYGDNDGLKYPPKVYELRERGSVVVELPGSVDRSPGGGGYF